MDLKSHSLWSCIIFGFPNHTLHKINHKNIGASQVNQNYVLNFLIRFKGNVTNYNRARKQTSLAILGSKAVTGSIELKDVDVTGNVSNHNRARKQTSLAILGSTAVTGSIVAE
jgi:hypothetical protein